MRTNRILFLLILSCGFSLIRAEPVRIGVSVLPLVSFMEEIGGEAVEVQALQQEGDSCSVFEPRPSILSWMAEADFFLRTGTAYETVLLDKFTAQFPHLSVLDLRKAVAVLAVEHEHHHGHGHGPVHEQDENHEDGGGDPHIWLDPVRLVAMGRFVVEHLAEAQPELKEDLERRLALFEKKAQAVHERLETLLKPYEGRAFFIYHPALAYFSDRYGLVQVSIAEGSSEPSAKALHDWIRKARASHVKAIFVQPQESRRHAEIIAQATGAELIEVNPMGRDWETNLLSIGEALARAFGE